MVVVKEAETRDLGWTVDEAIRAVVFGGIIGPSKYNEYTHESLDYPLRPVLLL